MAGNLAKKVVDKKALQAAETGYNLFQKFLTALTTIDSGFNIYVAKSDGTDGRIAFNDLFYDSGVPFLKPVADAAALSAIPTANLIDDTLVLQIDINQLKKWTGTAWIDFNPAAAGSLDPFDAIVDGVGTQANHYINEGDAIGAGKSFIYTIGGTLDTSVINVNRNIFIYRNGSAYHLSNQQGFNVAVNCSLEIISSSVGVRSSSVTGATLLCPNNFFQGNGTVKVNGITFIQGNDGAVAANTVLLFAEDCAVQTNGTNFFNIQKFGSKLKNIFIYGAGIGAAAVNAVVVGNGCTADAIEYYNATASTGTHITVQKGGKLTGLKGSGQTGGGGFPVVVLNQGEFDGLVTTYPISPVITNDGGTVSNCTIATATGFAPVTASLTNINPNAKVENVTFVNANITNDASAISPLFFGCNNTGGTFTNNSTTMLGIANTGTIPNIGVEHLYPSVPNIGSLPATPLDNSICFVAGSTLRWYYYANSTAGWVVASDSGISLQDVWNAIQTSTDAAPLQSTDLITIVREVSGTPTPFKITRDEFFSQVLALQAQADWDETDNTKTDFIKNKPNLYQSVATVGDLPASPLPNSICFVGGSVLRWYYYATTSWAVASDSGISLQDVWNAIAGAGTDTPDTTDLVLMIRDISGTQTPIISTITDFYDDISATIYHSPFSANVSDDTTFNAAIAAAKAVIFVDSSFTFTSSPQLLIDTKVYCGAGVQVFQNGGQIDTNNKIFSLEFISGFVSNGWQYDMATAGQSPFVNNNGTPNPYVPLQFFNARLSNLSSVANTPVSQVHKQNYNNSWVLAGNAANAGVNISVAGSSFNNLSIGASSGGASTNMFVCADGCVTGTGLSLLNNDVTYSSSLATIGENNPIYGINAAGTLGGGNAPISSKGQLYNLNSSDCTVSLTIDGASPVIDGANIGAASITINSTASNPKIMGSHATGTFTNNSTTYQGSSNSGSITNTGNTLSLSPYAAAIDGVGALSSHYMTFSAAYAAGKSEDYSTANITETSDLNFTPAGQLYAQVGQNSTWNLGVYSLVGSFAEDTSTTGANSFTLEFTDASSVFQWGNSTAGLPLSNFDDLSTVCMTLKGGVLQNLSTAADCYLYCAGTFIFRDGILLLPNASNGGIKTTNYTQISGAELTGGGSSCDTALTCEGGSVRDVVIDGQFTDNSKLIVSNKDTIYDGILLNVSTVNEVEVRGKASKILSGNSSGFIQVTLKPSLNPNGCTATHQSDCDQLSFETGTKGFRVSDCVVGILDLPSDNTVEARFSGVTVLNNCVLYGKLKFNNCSFPNGFNPDPGSDITITGSDSDVSIAWGAATKKLAANDTNIGNDY